MSKDEIVASTIVALLLVVPSYLLLVFATLTFNIVEWHPLLRLGFGVWAIVILYRSFFTKY